jgi:hypothetical protein
LIPLLQAIQTLKTSNYWHEISKNQCPRL